MSRFTVRVELHSATSSDYDLLHFWMQIEDFSRIIVADDGSQYHLPTAEYNLIGEYSPDDVLKKAKSAAANTGKAYAILVSKTDSRRWSGLEQVRSGAVSGH